MKKLSIALLALLIFYANYSFGQQKDSLLLSKSIPSGVFGKNRDILISLPAEYYTQPQRKFAVAYLFDAQSEALFNFTQATMRYLSLNNSSEPMILVGIKTQNRQFEFTPKNNTDEPYKKYRKDVKLGGADTLLASLQTEVFPYIEKTYRALPVRLGLGHSLGGTFVTYCLTQNKNVFDAIISVSPNYEYDKEQLVTRVERYVSEKKGTPSFLYLARGKNDSYETAFAIGIEKVVSLMNTKKLKAVQLEYDVLEIDNHGNTPLVGFVKGLIAFHNSIYSTAETIINYFTKLSGKAGYKLEAKQINQMAYDNFMYRGNYKEATEIFTWGINLYPDDHNLYDSMSEAHESLGNKKEALNYALQSMAKLEEQKSNMPIKNYEESKKYYSWKLAKLKK